MITINGIKLRDLEIADLFSRVLQENDYTDNIDTLIISANDRVSIQEPKYTILASNLMLHQINEEFENTIGNNNSSLYNYIQYMTNKGYYTKKLLHEYSKTEINVIGTFINSSFNYDYDYAGMNILNERYLTKDENSKLIETPELMYIVISMMLAIPEQKNKRLEKIKAFYEATHSRKISLATPILLNLRKNSGNLSSCFILNSEDSLLSINHTINSINLISQNAGGVGLNIGRIRAEGSEIGGVPESSGGVMNWVKILDSCITAVNQKGCVAKNSYVKKLESIDVVLEDNTMLNIPISLNKLNILNKFNMINNRYEDSINNALIQKIPEKHKHLYDFFKEYITIKKNQINFVDYAISKFGSVNIYKRVINKFKKNIIIPEGYRLPIINGKIISDTHAINKHGDIISLTTLKSLKLTLNGQGYLCFSINRRMFPVHRVAYHTFNSDVDYSMTIDHIDGNKLNNSLSNLQQLSSIDNIKKFAKDEIGSYYNKIKIRIIKHLDTGSDLNGKRSLTCVIKDLKFNYIDTLIYKIKKDDFVLAYDIKCNKTLPQRVLQSYSLNVEQKDQIKIIYEDSSYIITSKWHPLGILENNTIVYKRSDEIQVGECSVNFEGKLIKIVDIDNNPLISPLYHDLHIRNTNNYFASTDTKKGFNLTHNSRKGALTVALPIWHYDFEDFLHCQTENGDLRKKAFNIFPQVIIPDLFMNKLENNEDWFMFCPYEFKKEYDREINELNKKDFEEYYIKAIENNNIRKRIIKSKELFKKIMKVQLETGLPYIMFRDTTNEVNPNKHDGVIENANLCVSPETYITTKNGLKEIKELNGQEIELWNGKEWSLSKVFQTGENQKLIKIHFNNNSFIECTEYHKFPILENHSFSTLVFTNEFNDIDIVWKKAKDVNVGDRIFPYKDFVSGKLHKFVQVTEIEDNNRYDDTYCFTEPKRNMGMFNSVCLGQCVESFSNFKPSKVNSKPNLSNGTNIKQDITSGVAHTCNLVSPNLALIDTDEDIENIITLSVNILDNTIDITETPIPESKLHNEYYRIIGVGALGLADWLAKRKLTYKTGVKQVSELFEKIAYYGIKESIRLAKERGIYPLYEGSEWSKGIVFGKSKDWFENNETAINKNNWLSLLDELQQFGIRNGGIFAIAPNCQNPDNKVITKKGIKSIYDILEEQNINYKDIENSKIPQWVQLKNKVEVPTYEGDDYCERIWYNGKQKTVTIEFEDGNIYDFTYNHKLLVNTFGIEQWVKCEDLTIYDSIVTQYGYIFIKSINKEKEMETYDFEIKNNHHYLMENGVVSHNTSSSLLVGATASILPPFAKIFVDKNSKGAVTVIPPHLNQNTMWYYQENKNIPQQYVIDIISEIQEWVDQGISGELFLNIEDEIIKDAKDFYDLLLYCWKKKMKTIYYIRQAKPKTDSGCVSCAN